jgi:hypothetical protein
VANITHPNGYNLRELSAEVRDFIQLNEDWQELVALPPIGSRPMALKC